MKNTIGSTRCTAMGVSAALKGVTQGVLHEMLLALLILKGQLKNLLLANIQVLGLGIFQSQMPQQII